MAKQVVTSEEQLRAIVASAVAHAFRDVGIVAHDDEAVDERRRDFQFLHDLRRSTEGAKARVGAAFLITVAGGLVTVIVLGIKAWARSLL